MYISQKITCFFTALLFSATALATGGKNPYVTKGRTETHADNSITLIGAASSITFGLKGNQCTVNVRSTDTYSHHNYVVIEVDGQYYSRNKVTAAGSKLFVMAPAGGKAHTVTVYKATEATVGNILFTGVDGDISAPVMKPKKKIEFIGDSITCGMGNDNEEIPCGTGEWYDQHNAYYSYAPITARALGADFLLSSVSGIGMYRNWNDEHKDEAIMPDVYDNLYLNKDASKKYDYSFMPQVTCIALGTNDFSDGDGKKARLPFNEEKYVANYIAFVNNLYAHNPQTQVVLLNSPMVNGPKAATFIKCLNRIKDELNKQTTHKPVLIFTFGDVTPHGCGYHPQIEDDKIMAEQLTPFLKKLLN
ncbi:GDSL-type esterase/lipase family protein [Flavobacterium sp. RHBU_3]|uniref:SGNH/GDSL hydrolase family protein n=1 Tax=Flavobacterium sp. RHBU_3 TaxID=3391184 RepID=UPI003984CE2F